MANTLIDLLNYTLKYNEETITIIIDNKNNPWFSASNIVKILEYDHSNKSIREHVDDKHILQFYQLKKYVKKIPKNAQPNAKFINETRLYSLLLASKMPVAQEFNAR